MKYYKVVRKVGEELYSWIYIWMDKSKDQISVKYELNKVVTPNLPGSKLFVFGDIETACAFIGSLKYGSIYEVECTNVSKIDYIVDALSMRPQNVIDFWSGKQYPYKKHALQDSYVCDTVKLIRELSINEITSILKKLYGDEPN